MKEHESLMPISPESCNRIVGGGRVPIEQEAYGAAEVEAAAGGIDAC